MKNCSLQNYTVGSHAQNKVIQHLYWYRPTHIFNAVCYVIVIAKPVTPRRPIRFQQIMKLSTGRELERRDLTPMQVRRCTVYIASVPL